MAISKKYVGGAVQTSVVGSMTPTVPGAGQTFSVTDATGYPASGRFVVKLNRGLSDEEKVLISSRSGTTFTVELRGYDDTTAQSHAGPTCELTLDANTIQLLVDHADDVEADPHSTKLLNNARHDVTARHTFGAALGTPGTPTALTPDIAGSAGVGSVPSRADHVHNVPAATAGTITGSNGEGVAASFARSDHDHALGAGVVNNTNIFDGAVTAAKLATDAVTTVKITDGNVTTAKLANDAVTPAKTKVSYARVRRSSDQTVGNVTESEIVWNLEEVDTDGFWASTPNPQRLTPPSAGIAEVTCSVRFAADTTGRRQLRLVHTIGGVPTIISESTTDGISTDPTALSVASGPVPVSSGDFFIFTVIQESGGNLALLGDSLGNRGTNASIVMRET